MYVPSVKGGHVFVAPNTETSYMLNCIVLLIVTHTSVHYIFLQMLVGFWCSLIGCSGFGNGLKIMYTIKVDTWMNVIQLMEACSYTLKWLNQMGNKTPVISGVIKK
jgi:hypothetical protein